MRPISKLAATWIAVAVVLILALAGCTGNNNPITPGPSAGPTPTIMETTANPEPSNTPPTKPTAPSTREPETQETTKVPEVSPTSDAAAPPATQFAQRWGQRYPNVPEFAILKAANATCAVIEELGNGWETNPAGLLAFQKAVEAAGLSENDALEFAQDANQNYCASVANPT